MTNCDQNPTQYTISFRVARSWHWERFRFFKVSQKAEIHQVQPFSHAVGAEGQATPDETSPSLLFLMALDWVLWCLCMGIQLSIITILQCTMLLVRLLGRFPKSLGLAGGDAGKGEIRVWAQGPQDTTHSYLIRFWCRPQFKHHFLLWCSMAYTLWCSPVHFGFPKKQTVVKSCLFWIWKLFR